MKVLKDGKFIEVTDEEIIDDVVAVDEPIDKITALVEGLSTATSISQIRNVAKQILEETE